MISRGTRVRLTAAAQAELAAPDGPMEGTVTMIADDHRSARVERPDGRAAWFRIELLEPAA